MRERGERKGTGEGQRDVPLAEWEMKNSLWHLKNVSGVRGCGEGRGLAGGWAVERSKVGRFSLRILWALWRILNSSPIGRWREAIPRYQQGRAKERCFGNIILAAGWSRVKKKTNWSETSEGLSWAYKQEMMVAWARGWSCGNGWKRGGCSDIKDKLVRVWWLIRCGNWSWEVASWMGVEGSVGMEMAFTEMGWGAEWGGAAFGLGAPAQEQEAVAAGGLLSEAGRSRTRPGLHSSPDLAREHRHLEPLYLKRTQGEVQLISRGALSGGVVYFYSHSP